MTTLIDPQSKAAAEQAAVDAWNRAHSIGTPVIAYPFVRPEHPVAVRYREAVKAGLPRMGEDDPCTRIVTSTRSKATVLSGHTAVVWVHGHSACIALTHVDVRTQATPGELAEMRHLLIIADADDRTRPFVDLRKGRKAPEIAADEAAS